MKSPSRRGFTLIELLTVIAIISVLAAFTASILPGVLERVKIASTVNAFNQIRTAMTAYYTDQGSYPPHYGFVDFEFRTGTEATVPPTHRFLRPYMDYIGKYRTFDLYDTWSLNHDTNNDGEIGPLEFEAVNDADFALPIYPLNGNQMTGLRATEERPFAYLPVETRQVQRVERFYDNVADPLDRWNARVWDTTDPLLSSLGPAPKYDKFVLISIGPRGSTGGILDMPAFLIDPTEGAEQRNIFHRAVLRAYFLATRDANGNRELDFDFRARTRKTEGKAASYTPGDLYLLPDGTALAGPLIYVSP